MQPDDTINLRQLTSYLQTWKQEIKKEILESEHPIGSFYCADSLDDSPKNKLGFGTWERVEGKFIVGASDSDGDFDVGDTGGAKTHTLTVAEMPSHNHSVYAIRDLGVVRTNLDLKFATTNTWSANSQTFNSGTAGSGSPHNNLPPYLATYMWQRTA